MSQDSETKSQDSSSADSCCSAPCGGGGCKHKSEPFWEKLHPKVVSHNRQGEGGQTVVVCFDPKEQVRGGAGMPNVSTWHNEATVCRLSDILETENIPQKFFLSAKACAGILRRAESRGKKLPEQLEAALKAVIQKGDASSEKADSKEESE